MSITILKSRASIEAAIATMNPIAKEAAELLAHRLLENPDLVQNQTLLEDEWYQACALSLMRSGIDPRVDELRTQLFMENHGSAVINIACSIAVFIVEDARRRQRWGWIGKAAGIAALAAGVAIGSFFG